jgi:hypothetical protein
MKAIEIDLDSIRNEARIYTSEDDKLTEYQKKVNQASIDLCGKNPSLLLGKKGDLMKMAQDKVHSDGYNYKKGKSRSKRTLSSSSNPDSTKRTKIDTQEREARIGDILEQISDIDKRITFKQRRIETATATRNFKTCDELSEEISELKSQRRELNCELVPLQKKAKKSSWYFQNKAAKHKDSHTTSDSQSDKDTSVSDPAKDDRMEDDAALDDSLNPRGLPPEQM